MNKEIITDKNLVAYCGLYCGACRAYLKRKCQACKDNEKASWCKVRKCCIENNFTSCADCNIKLLEECKYFNNFMAKLFGFIFRSDRTACINRIKKIGYDAFAQEMAESKRQTIKRK